MSDTPRTDAMEIELRQTYDDVAVVNFARELERENVALKIERNRYKVALQDIADASGEWAGDKAREVLEKGGQP